MATVADEIRKWLSDITQGFRWNPSNVQAHSGVDIGLSYGTPIYAIHSGVINYSGVKAWGGQISEVETAYGQPITDSYLHLSQELVSSGQHVQAGQLIGYSGSPPTRQYGTGPHLHYEETFGNQAPYVSASNPWRPTAQSFPLNPIPLLKQMIGGSGNPLDPGSIMVGITPVVAPVLDTASAISNLANQLQNFPQNAVNQVGGIFKAATGVENLKDLIIRGIIIGFAFFLGMLGFLAIIAEVISSHEGEIKSGAATAAMAAA